MSDVSQAGKTPEDVVRSMLDGGDPHAYTGPYDDHVEVEAHHRAAVAAVLPGVSMVMGNVVAQMLADAEANGAKAGYEDGHRDAIADAAHDFGDRVVMDAGHLDDLRNAIARHPYSHGLAALSHARPYPIGMLVGAVEDLADRTRAAAARDVEQLAELQRHRASLAAVVAEDRPTLAAAWSAGWTAGDADADRAARWHAAGERQDDDVPTTPNPYAD